MNKISYQIKKGTKDLILGLSVLGVLGLSALHDRKAKTHSTPVFAFIGLVATMKKKGVWESASEETKAFAEAQDEADKERFKGLLKLDELDEKLKEFTSKAEEKGLGKEDMAAFKEMLTGYKNIAQEIQKMKDTGIGSKQYNAIKQLLADNDASIKEFKSKKRRDLDLETKATQDTPDIADHTIGLYIPGIGQLPVRKPFILDLFTIIPTTKERIKYMDQESIVRDAKNVAGINVTAHNTKVTWKERYIEICKIRDFIYISLDMLDDYDFVQGEIQNLLSTSVMLKVDQQLLLGDGAAPNLHSINEYSSEFDASNTIGGTIDAFAGSVQEPNVFDLCVAMAAQIVALGQDSSYMPDTVLWNTVDKYKSMLVKDKNNNYILPPFVVRAGNKEYTIDGMKVRSNPLVPANSMYMFDSTKGVVYMRKGMGIEMAYNNNDDFEREQATTKGYIRLNFFVRKVHQNAFMKCSDVDAALVALKGPGL